MADARLARIANRLLTRGTPEGRLAGIANRFLTRGTPEARLANASTRALIRLNINEGEVARIGLRSLVSGPFGVFVNVWTGTAFVDCPVRIWDGTHFVDAIAVKVWNGSAFVDAI